MTKHEEAKEPEIGGLNGTSLSAMETDYYQALAVGDRVRAAGILKRLFDALKDVDPDQIKAGMEFIKKLIDLFAPAPAEVSISSDSISALSADDAQAAGIISNPQLYVTMAQILFELLRRFRAEIRGQEEAVASVAKAGKGSKKHDD